MQQLRKILYTIFYSIIMLWLTALICFAIYYLSHSYDELKQWYLSINDCFYRHQYWDTEFFTPQVKAKANITTFIAIPVSIFFIMHIIRRWRMRLAETGGITTQLRNLWPWYTGIAAGGIILWLIGNNILRPAYDEIFSAINCAALPPFQTIAYYMLPNNHVYFNLVNGLFPVSDHVFTGKLLSLPAYIGVLWCAFTLFTRLFTHCIWALVAVLPVALQFTVWAFSFQARGYEWQLLCGWVAFITLLQYLRTDDRWLLRVNMIATIIGFALVPTFLYFFQAQLVFVCIIQLSRRQFDWLFWRYQLFSLAGVLLCYVPAISFSGIDAISNNRYVNSNREWNVFIPHLREALNDYVNYCFGMLGGENNPVNYILIFLPVLLLFSKDKMHRQWALLLILMWTLVIVMSLYMRQRPYNRNMILHYSLTLACVVYMLYIIASWIAQHLPARIRWAGLTICFAIPVILYGIHQYRWNTRNIFENLYFNPVNKIYADHEQDIAGIPAGSSISFSDEGFYWLYRCRLKGYDAHRCTTGSEDYYIKRSYEPFPNGMESNYELLRKGSEDYEIYKRK